MAMASTRRRARDLGILIPGLPGPWNAITDVAGVEVGETTRIAGAPVAESAAGTVRTGITVILPRGRRHDPVLAGWAPFNGNGEMTGTTWVAESGFLEGPVGLTNTHSVGAVHEALIRWQVEAGVVAQGGSLAFSLPVVAETYDGWLNDINGFHVGEREVRAALDGARSGPVAEGNVGGGTGMICHGVKGGTGTASRRVAVEDRTVTVGVLVQANHGRFEELTVAGVPVGRLMPAPPPVRPGPGDGSIVVVVATDAPLLPHQLERLCRRAPVGIGRVGGIGANGSGDLVLAFSTANPGVFRRSGRVTVEMMPNDLMTPLFHAVAEATEEAILNAIVAAETMTGACGRTATAIDLSALCAVLARYRRTPDQTESPPG